MGFHIKILLYHFTIHYAFVHLQEAVDFVRAHLAQSKKSSAEALRDACEALCDECLSHDPIKSEGMTLSRKVVF